MRSRNRPTCTPLVMELIAGEDLSQRIARGAILIDEALPIAKQIADAGVDRPAVENQRAARSLSTSYPQVRHLADQDEMFLGLCGFSGDTFNVGPPDALKPVGGAWVSGSYYQTLGLVPVA